MWIALSRTFAVVFALIAALQYNDPDPLRWVVVYALATVVAWRGPDASHARATATALGTIAAVWALTLAPDVIGTVHPAELTQPMQGIDSPVERGREMGGLTIVVAGMALVAAAAGRATTPVSPADRPDDGSSARAA